MTQNAFRALTIPRDVFDTVDFAARSEERYSMRTCDIIGVLSIVWQGFGSGKEGFGWGWCCLSTSRIDEHARCVGFERPGVTRHRWGVFNV